MRYFIASQNLVKSGIKLPKHAILRVNLAWHKDLCSLERMLTEHSERDIFLDIPIGRKKPPNHSHALDEIAKIANLFRNVKYVAISNVESVRDIHFSSKRFGCKIVPKIETYKGALNLLDIIDSLDYKPAVIMLDHEDLFSNLVHLKKEKLYLNIVDKIIEVCRRKHAVLLRVKGVIFAND